jgi:hypothetical protein
MWGKDFKRQHLRAIAHAVQTLVNTGHFSGCRNNVLFGNSGSQATQSIALGEKDLERMSMNGNVNARQTAATGSRKTKAKLRTR